MKSENIPNQNQENKVAKSAHALREEKILAYWKDNGIFERTLSEPSSGKKFKGEYIFYEGPPTANGRPGIHHLEARAFKDVIPRYKTMQGFHVRRKGGWDTHGLPVELQVEKELGLKSKKEIEAYGMAAFNKRCKESVWTYVHEWEDFTERIGYWVDLKDPYITYKTPYIESVWNILKTVYEKDLLYKDYKVVPWCPRCGTALSSHELAQGYEDVKDLSVFVKFKVKKDDQLREKTAGQSKDIYLLAWTTTPWTLPGNVGLAVNEKIDYVEVEIEGISYILAKDRLAALKDKKYQITMTVKGKDLVGMEYEPLYPFLLDNIIGPEKDKVKNAYKVYGADFVTTTDGTGIVHTAVMYGQDDFELGTKVGLPKYHLVNEDGTFKPETGFLAGAFVKDPETDVNIIKDLAHRGLLFDKEKYQHSYPHCWRCHTPLIYFARDSWYIRMMDLRKKLVKENEGINWEPAHIKEGRFGEWLREVKDWAISRERYWGTPLPIWVCNSCKKWKAVGSVAEVSTEPKNRYMVMRHGEAENNVAGILDSKMDSTSHLTDKGREDVKKTAAQLKKEKIDLIFVSPLARTKDTAEIVREAIGLDRSSVIVEERLRELDMDSWNGKKSEDFNKKFPLENRFGGMSDGVEDYGSIKKRVGQFLYELEAKHAGKNILIVTHASPAMMLMAAAAGLDNERALDLERLDYILKAEARELYFQVVPHNDDYELDLHRPYIDEVKIACSCGGEMRRVKEVMDVWFDSGSMPFAQDHYPFENKKFIDKGAYPADFISEAIDQTRGWFYTLHAIGVLMGKGKAYKNVICLGHILDEKGKKMSKSIGNVVNPWEMMDKYGVDALRMWMYSVNQPGDSKNFEQKTVDEVNKKIFNLAANVLSFYELYAGSEMQVSALPDLKDYKPNNALDIWIVARLNELVTTVTDGLESFKFFEPTRAIREFIGDLSQWYLRRSRERFKAEDESDKRAAIMTTRLVLATLSKVMAPFAPFFAESLYQGIKGERDSVHLEPWPKSGKIDGDAIKAMEIVRKIASLGLEARMSAKINVRQPLSALKLKASQTLAASYVSIIKDEVNVKEVIWGANIEKEVELDTAITAELKEEGEVRELLRRIQDIRKEKGLKVSDMAVLVATEDLRPIISKNIDLVKDATKLSAVEYGVEFGLKANV